MNDHQGLQKCIRIILTSCFSFCMAASPLEAASNSATKATPDPQVGRLVKKIINPNSSMPQKSDAFQLLLQLDRHACMEGLRELARSQSEDYAPMAASILVRFKDPQGTNITQERYAQWDARQRDIVLDAVLERSQLEDVGQKLSGLARVSLREYLNEGHAVAKHDSRMISADVACLILRNQTDADDRKLLEQALLVRPSSVWIWIAIGRGQLLLPEVSKLAKTVYADNSESALIRTAAAAILSDKNPQAADFAGVQIAGVIERRGSQDISQMLSDARKAATQPAASRKKTLGVREEMILLSLVRFLPSDQAKPLLAKALMASNPLVHMTAAVVAAERWPEQALAMKQEPLSDEEYGDVMALVAIKHPELAEKAANKIKGHDLKSAIERLNSMGWRAAFGGSGAVVS